MDGFISAVILHYVTPSCDPPDWGWWRFHRESWARIDPAVVTNGDVRFVVFDEDSVRGA